MNIQRLKALGLMVLSMTGGVWIGSYKSVILGVIALIIAGGLGGYGLIWKPKDEQ